MDTLLKKIAAKRDELRLKWQLTFPKPRRNPPEIVRKVKALEPELDVLMEQEFRDVAAQILDHLDGEEAYLLEKREIARQIGYPEDSEKISKLDRLLAECEEARHFTPAQREEYIARYAKEQLHLFAGSYYLSALKKVLLWQHYRIYWLTPSDEYPQYDFMDVPLNEDLSEEE